jgi:hypothetical protein
MSRHVDTPEQAALRAWARGKALELVTAALEAKPGEPAELLQELFDELPTITQGSRAWRMLLLEVCQVAVLSIHNTAAAVGNTPQSVLQDIALALLNQPPST